MITESRKYLKQIRRAFPLFHKTEQRFYQDFTASVDEYAEQNPICTEEDLIQRFGDPKNVVCTYFDSMEPETYFSTLNRSVYLKRALAAFVAFLLAMLVMAFCFWYSAWTASIAAIPDNMETTIYYHNETEETT